MKQILTAIDFSDATEAVLAMTVEMATLTGSTVRILHTSPTEIDSLICDGYLPCSGWGEFSAQNECDGPDRGIVTADRLSCIHEQLASRGIHAECIELKGPSAELILAEAESCQADLIIMGTHRHGLFYYLLVGSTRDSVLKNARCPVLVVPATPEEVR